MLYSKAEGSLIHVAVAVIIKNGHVLISKRAQNVHQGGLWEFPGGKVESGEMIFDALGREIMEELGIHINNARSLIKLVHHYSDKSVVLDTLIVTSFEGKNYQLDSALDNQKQLGLEGQLVKWVRLEELDNYQFPAANQAIINALMLPKTYLITPDYGLAFENIEQFIDEFSNSIQCHRLVQLRIKPSLENKESNNKELNQLIRQVIKLSKRKSVQLLMNSSMLLEYMFLEDMLPGDKLFSDETVDLIELIDGIHLTSSDLHDSPKVDYIKRYRKQFPSKKIAASCHCMRDIEQANDLKLDFIVVSAVKSTTSHPDQKPLGWKLFKRLTDRAEMPVYALGGMTPSDINLAQDNGAQGISAISSLWNKDESCIDSDKI